MLFYAIMLGIGLAILGSSFANDIVRAKRKAADRDTRTI